MLSGYTERGGAFYAKAPDHAWEHNMERSLLRVLLAKLVEVHFNADILQGIRGDLRSDFWINLAIEHRKEWEKLEKMCFRKVKLLA